jgi:hypothetical protein
LAPVKDFESGFLFGVFEEQSIILDKDDNTRMKVTQELFHTEQTYVKNLDIMHRAYCVPLTKANISQTQKPILKQAICNEIFAHPSSIFNVQKELLADLTEEYEKARSNSCYIAKIGFVFEKYVRLSNFQTRLSVIICLVFSFFFLQKAEMKVYSQYAIELQKILAIVEEQAKRHQRFNKFLTEVANSHPECFGKSLQSFLIMPIQRIPRYILLINVGFLRLFKCL